MHPCRLAPALVLALSPALAAQIAVPVYQHDASSPLGLDGKDSRVIATADVDGDGDLDVFVGNSGQDDLLYLNLPRTGLVLAPPMAMTSAGGFALDAAFGDLDGDGDPDLAIANGHGADNTLWRNDGGRFGRPSPGDVELDAGESHGVAWGDVDDDGDQDLAFANAWTSNVLCINEGRGMLRHTQRTDPVTTATGSSRDVALADLDGDGDLELLFANGNDEANFVYVNRGGAQGGRPGAYELLQGGPLAADRARSEHVNAGDFDNDGDLDVFVSNGDGQDNVLYVNGGRGLQFTRAAVGSRDGGDSQASAWGDLDADGDLDLVVVNREQPDVLYLNQDDELVRAGALGASAGDSRHVTLADLDQDGRLEALVAHGAGESNGHLVYQGTSWTDIVAATSASRAAVP